MGWKHPYGSEVDLEYPKQLQYNIHSRVYKSTPAHLIFFTSNIKYPVEKVKEFHQEYVNRDRTSYWKIEEYLKIRALFIFRTPLQTRP